MQKITVKTKKEYDIYVGSDVLKTCGEMIKKVFSAGKVVVVTDDIVEGLYADTVVKSLTESGFEVSVFSFKNGEQQKTHSTLLKLYDFLVDADITRKDLIVALGGGVVGDLAGYAAATYLRGIDFVQIPTTLLAQVDSSVGGKTAVDIEKGKNLVGAFHQPCLVICDVKTLDTLSDEIFSDGMAELIKHGIIKSKPLFDLIKTCDIKEEILPVITESIKIKANVVANDEFENGERMLLNFGHTLGHGIEKYYKFSKYTHGTAVAIGMAKMSKLSEQLGLTQKGCYDEIVEVLGKYNLPIDDDVSGEELYRCSVNDKKRQKNMINIILAEQIGKAYIKKMPIDEFKVFLCEEK